MSGATAALRAAVREALAAVEGVGVHDLRPVQAAFPYAEVECGPETDWGHKSGDGRELRVAVVVRERGERPERIHMLAEAVEAAIGAMENVAGEWQLVSLRPVRMRATREPQGWAASVEYRARMLRSAGPG